MVITLTDNASAQIKEMMQEESAGAHLRFGIKGGGCSGLSYSLGFEYDINEELDVVEDINGIPVVFFNQDIPIIEGTTIDFKQNMMGGGFAIDNPNAIVSCGCGSSFRTKDKVGTPGDC
ncbi:MULTISPECIES: iron-sulfur cluster assembly accessory protein [Oceanobacillus]|uniref:Iron-sulfur cluster assembly protein n=2 Tax=Oceanobacillus TaxID=182709 RepID=A0A9X1CEX5_9BACI|nr:MULTISPECIES: iron-sulfur cluster assembly accessory protein [Oceanobacillus]MBR3121002.1 iron-sulfur cluster assembly accessory protein [Oceanobacillus sp.]PAE29735.1 iron-sulfur cluster assembly accessory protein [Paenibacillus sp. 7884-2]MBP2076467.1 iron-sulfur cluster assembly protein [Oceanobacillus polygoni]MCM3399084.1 iron-sulfur cluster assembly accessory protein [Oceanobacillus profundus]MDO6449105.1 iron-sulfur cluster assembly accessory protein [Oceanobacillus profundus]